VCGFDVGIGTSDFVAIVGDAKVIYVKYFLCRVDAIMSVLVTLFRPFTIVFLHEYSRFVAAKYKS